MVLPLFCMLLADMNHHDKVLSMDGYNPILVNCMVNDMDQYYMVVHDMVWSKCVFCKEVECHKAFRMIHSLYDTVWQNAAKQLKK